MNRALAVLLLLPLVAGLAWFIAGRAAEQRTSVGRAVGDAPATGSAPDEVPEEALVERAAPESRDAATRAAVPVDVPVAAEEQALPADQVLVRGRVTDTAGAPVPHARIQYCRQRHDKLEFSDLAPRADADGVYAVRPETQHWHPLRAWAAGYGAHHRGPFSPNKYVQKEVDFVLGHGEPLSGSVTLPDGAPAVGARVEVQRVIGKDLMSEDQPNVHMAYRDSLQPIAYDLVADDGSFGLLGLLSGPYRVVATLAQADGTRLTAVADDVPTRERDLHLQLAAPITVVAELTDERGEPITEQYLNLEPLFGNAEKRWDESFVVHTGALAAPDGRYEIELPFGGRWTLWPNKRGYLVPRELRERVYVFPRPEPVRLQLTRMASLAGRVVDSRGAGLASVELRLLYGPGGQPRAKTDAQGAFHFPYAMPGPFEIVIGGDEEPALRHPLNLAPGEERADVELVLGGVGAVEVTLLDAEGQPAPEGRWIEMRRGEQEHEGKSDARGRGRFEGVEPGRWTIFGLAGPDGGGGHTAMMAQLASDEIDVRAGATTEVVLRALPYEPLELHGRVTRGGEPLAGARIIALRDGGFGAEVGDGEKLRKDGSYELELARPGLYSVYLTLDGEPRRTYSRALEIGACTRKRFDIELADQRIAGVVRHPDGTPAANVPVAIEALEERWALFVDGFGTSTRTDEHGAFSIDGLEAEAWRVCATDPETRSVACADEVHAGGADATSLALTLAPSQAIDGSVVAPNGDKPEALLFAFDPAKRPHTRQGVQNRSDGRFGIDGRADRARIYALTWDGRCGVVDGRAGEEARIVVTEGGTLELRSLTSDGRGRLATLRLEDADGYDLSHLIGPSLREVGFMTKLYRTRVALGPLPPGRYVASARTDQGGFAQSTIEVRAGDHTVVELVP